MRGDGGEEGGIRGSRGKEEKEEAMKRRDKRVTGKREWRGGEGGGKEAH